MPIRRTLRRTPFLILVTLLSSLLFVLFTLFKQYGILTSTINPHHHTVSLLEKDLNSPHPNNILLNCTENHFLSDDLSSNFPLSNQKDDGFIFDTSWGSADGVLSQTICEAGSRFRSLERESVPYDSFRLMYLAIHQHQYGPAKDEALHKRKCGFSGGSSFDYKCPGTKYLVVDVPGAGLGASLRLAGVDALLLGIVTGRVVLLMNNIRSSFVRKRLQIPWQLVSCSRMDVQCAFLPLSPCVITLKDLENSTHLDGKTVQYIRNTGTLPSEYENVTVLTFDPVGSPTKKPLGWREKLLRVLHPEHNVSSTIYREKSTVPLWEMSTSHYSAVLEEIRQGSNEWMFDAAADFFLFRLNSEFKRKVQVAIDRSFPADFDTEAAIGLPIRSSDKCFRESECLSFDDYMTIATNLANRRILENRTTTYDTIVLTSESTSVVESKDKYQANKSFPFRFVVNDLDVMQGSGNPSTFHLMSRLNVTADDIMVSTMTALIFQLKTKVTVGNCCSNFHKIIASFVSWGCGPVHDSRFECLQDNEVLEFRLCCQWSSDSNCRQKRTEGNYGTRFQIGSDNLHPNVTKK